MCQRRCAPPVAHVCHMLKISPPQLFVLGHSNSNAKGNKSVQQPSLIASVVGMCPAATWTEQVRTSNQADGLSMQVLGACSIDTPLCCCDRRRFKLGTQTAAFKTLDTRACRVRHRCNA